MVLPGADAKSGEVADAKAVFKYFRLKNDLKYFTTEIKIVPVWTFSLALGGEEFDTVDMTLQKRTVSSGITHENWAGYSTGGMYRCELLRVMTPLDGNATFSATIEGVSVSSEVYGAGSLEKILNFSDMTFGSSSLTASGTYSSAKQVEVVTADDKIALEGAVKEVTDALTEELRQLNETSIPRYIFTEVEVEDGSVNLLPYTNAKLLSDGTAFEVAVGEGDGKTRDCVLRVECGETAPTITWGANFHPRTDAETDFACVAGKRNVYWITEHAPNEFVVAGWQETEGGSAE